MDSAPSAGLISRAFAQLGKDLRVEIRNRTAFGTILLFCLSTLIVVAYAFGGETPEPRLQSALLWIILFFSSLAGTIHSFVQEEQTGTAFYLRVYADPSAVFLGKLCFTIILLTIVTAVSVPLYFTFLGPWPESTGLLMLLLSLGVLSLCSATTLVSALVARSGGSGSLFAVLAFPILIVPLLALVTATTKLLDSKTFDAMAGECQVLAAFIVVMLTASIMLFSFVWRD